MVIVDYADLMAPERYTDNSIENSKNIYVSLRGLAMQEDIALLTATQTNREGFKSSVAKAEHVSEDFNKIRIADIVISINRTEEERAVGQARLYFAASRNQAGQFTVRIKQDMERMRFISEIIGEE
jgi:replicative DNA helicase